MRKSLPVLLLSLAFLALLAPGAAHARKHGSADAASRSADFLPRVLEHLARSPSPIAANTLVAIRDGAIQVDTLDRLTVEDCRMLLTENPAQWSGVAEQDECVPQPDGRARVPRAILDRVSGYQHENRIYIRAGGRVADAAATVVHETNHVVNGTHHRYATAREKLEEEYRAYWVALVFTDGKPPAAGYLRWLKSWIVEQYALDGVAPDDLPNVPTGILDNRLPVRPGDV